MFFLVARSYYSSKGPRYEYQGPRYYVANVPRWHLNHASSRGACHDTGERPRGTTRPGSASARNSRGGGCGVPSGRSGRNAAGGTSRPRRCCVHRPRRCCASSQRSSRAAQTGQSCRCPLGSAVGAVRIKGPNYWLDRTDSDFGCTIGSAQIASRLLKAFGVRIVIILPTWSGFTDPRTNSSRKIR